MGHGHTDEQWGADNGDIEKAKVGGRTASLFKDCYCGWFLLVFGFGGRVIGDKASRGLTMWLKQVSGPSLLQTPFPSAPPPLATWPGGRNTQLQTPS